MDAERVVSALFEAGTRKAKNGPLIQDLSLQDPLPPPPLPPIPPILSSSEIFLTCLYDWLIYKIFVFTAEESANKASSSLPSYEPKEGPSLLEQMMAEQLTAAKLAKEKKLTEVKAVATSNLKGFKKGFLSSKETIKKPLKTTSNDFLLSFHKLYNDLFI